jgi:hypothetical protein
LLVPTAAREARKMPGASGRNIISRMVFCRIYREK